MVASRRFLFGLLACTLSVLTLSSPASARQKANVLPPTAMIDGLSSSEWAARWWQWAYSIPKPVNPLYDATGANVAEGQTGHVWFLGGIYSTSGTVVRNVTIPLGVHLFFPILNIGDNRICPGEIPVPVEVLRQELRDLISFEDMSAEIDGLPVVDIASRFEESVAFDVTVPADSIACSGNLGVAGTFGPMVDEGYYLMVPPLSKGTHVIHFHGTERIPQFDYTLMTLDITYNITTVPPGEYYK